ncbi:MAG: FkbM family methyltransferase [Cytophagia bacterium]|nr:MAG: FkbM family methyltransferase [Cytophagia bacterium]
MFNKIRKYFKDSFARKKARRFFQKYPYEIITCETAQYGKVEYAVWKNPIADITILNEDEINFYKKFIKKGDLCIDIGANVGDTTVPMAIVAEKEGLTLAFEPNPHIFEITKANAALNQDKTNIVPIPYAITETEGDFFYSSSEASFGNGGISQSKEETKKHGKFVLEQKISGVNLEAYLLKNYPQYIDKLSYIKIDTEGYDIIILNSIQNLIKKYTPFLVVECFSEANLEERKKLLRFFEERDYTLYYFSAFSQRADTVLLNENNLMNWDNFNFYAIHKDKKLKKKKKIFNQTDRSC